MARGTRTIQSPSQIPLITPKSDWRPPTWAELEAIDLNRYARVGFDTETRDPDLLEKGSCWATPSRGGHVAGVSARVVVFLERAVLLSVARGLILAGANRWLRRWPRPRAGRGWRIPAAK